MRRGIPDFRYRDGPERGCDTGGGRYRCLESDAKIEVRIATDVSGRYSTRVLPSGTYAVDFSKEVRIAEALDHVAE